MKQTGDVASNLFAAGLMWAPIAALNNCFRLFFVAILTGNEFVTSESIATPVVLYLDLSRL